MLVRHAAAATKTRTNVWDVIGSVRSLSSTNNMFDPSSFWSDLRQKAAAAITSSLSDRERDALMSKYKPVEAEPVATIQKDDDNDTGPKPTASSINGETDNDSAKHLSKTISEAVAEARAKEAQLLSDKFQKEMDQLKQSMQEASEERIKLEVSRERQRLQFDQWQQDLKKEKELRNSSIQSTAETETKEQAADAEGPVDSVLGPVILDLGNKRLHVVSAETLSNLPVWRKQRTYRHDRAKSMAKDKMKSLHLGMPGVIGLYQDGNGNLSILDGQHRVGMMKILEEKQAGIDLSKVVVEVYTDPEQNGKDDHAIDLFTEINKAEPAKLIDMPGVAKKSEKGILDAAAEKLQDSYPDMFSSSQKCRSPHLNIDNLRDNLFAAGVLQKHSIKTNKAMMTWLLEKNVALEAKYGKGKIEGVPAKALEKARKFGFYLGLESGWMRE